MFMQLLFMESVTVFINIMILIKRLEPFFKLGKLVLMNKRNTCSYALASQAACV